MATQAAVQKKLDTVYGHVRVDVWGPLGNADTITPFALPQNADRTVQFEGTFGAAGIYALQGSNDGVTFHTLHDPLGNAISTGVSALYQILENPWFIAPILVSGGDGTTSVTVSLCSRGTL